MTHTTKWGNTYTDEEWAEMQENFKQQDREASEYPIILNKAVKKAAGFLNREFTNVPTKNWEAAIREIYRFDREPKEIKFTSVKKEERFNAALKWIDKNVQVGLDAI